MTFVLVETPRFWWPVTVSVPDTKTPGRFMRQSFEVEFEAIGTDEAERLRADFAAKEGEEARRAQHYLLERVVTGWRGVVDTAGAAVPYSGDTLVAAAAQPWVARGLYEAWTAAMTGEARRGN